jgi:hydrogenase maturation protease
MVPTEYYRDGQGMALPKADVLILGIGNILLSDEGVGVHAIRLLAERKLPPGIDILDGGTSGADLVDHLDGRTKIVVIDAALGDGAPGTVYRCEGDELVEQTSTLSLHEFGLVESLRLAKQLGCSPGAVIILGIQPATMEVGMNLSPIVAAVLPSVIQLAIKEALDRSAIHSAEHRQDRDAPL